MRKEEANAVHRLTTGWRLMFCDGVGRLLRLMKGAGRAFTLFVSLCSFFSRSKFSRILFRVGCNLFTAPKTGDCLGCK